MSEKLELIHEVEERYTRKYEYFQKDRDRFIEHARLYWGVGNTMWPDELVDEMHSEGRQTPQMYVMANKLDGLHSTLLRNQMDMRLTPMEGAEDDLTLAAQDMYYSDRDCMGWNYTWDTALRDFLIQFCVERMDVSTEYNRIGNIKFFHENPILIFPDPGWHSPFIKDLDDLDRIGHWDFHELLRMYPKKKAELEESKFIDYFVKRLKSSGVEYPDHQTGIPYQDLDMKYGTKQRVIEHHEMRDEKRDVKYNLRDGFIQFPDFGFVPNSKEAEAADRDYIEKNQLSPEQWKTFKEMKRVYHVTTICSAYSVVLEDKDSNIQIGYLPFLISGTARFGSQFRGIADLLKDIQYNTNKYILMMQEILNRAARNGFFLDPEIVGGDDVAMGEIEKKWNRSDFRQWTKRGAGLQGLDKFMQEIPSGTIPSDLFAFNNLMEGFANKHSYQPPAMAGMNESSKETGRLFQSKYEAAIISRGVVDKMIELHEYQRANMWLDFGKILYSGPPRSFSRRGGGEPIHINQRLPGGRTINDISKLQRCRIILAPSTRSIDVRVDRRGRYAEIKQTNKDPLMGAIYDKRILSTMEMADDEREESDIAAELTIKEAALAKILNIQNMKAKLSQLKKVEDAAEAEGQAEGQAEAEGAPRVTEGRKTIRESTAGSPVQEEFSEKEMAKTV